MNFHIQELLAPPAGVKGLEREANLLAASSTEVLACMESLPSHPIIQLGRDYCTFAFSFSSRLIFMRDLTVLQNLKKVPIPCIRINFLNTICNVNDYTRTRAY